MKHEVQIQIQIQTKLLTLSDIENTDHIGWIHNDCNEKGYITKIDHDKYVAVAASGQSESDEMVDVYDNPVHKNITKALEVPLDVAKFYKFDTRKELYQWLAE